MSHVNLDAANLLTELEAQLKLEKRRSLEKDSVMNEMTKVISELEVMIEQQTDVAQRSKIREKGFEAEVKELQEALLQERRRADKAEQSAREAKEQVLSQSIKGDSLRGEIEREREICNLQQQVANELTQRQAMQAKAIKQQQLLNELQKQLLVAYVPDSESMFEEDTGYLEPTKASSYTPNVIRRSHSEMNTSTRSRSRSNLTKSPPSVYRSLGGGSVNLHVTTTPRLQQRILAR